MRASEPVQTTPRPVLAAVTLLVLSFLSCEMGLVRGPPPWAPVQMQ